MRHVVMTLRLNKRRANSPEIAADETWLGKLASESVSCFFVIQLSSWFVSAAVDVHYTCPVLYEMIGGTVCGG